MCACRCYRLDYNKLVAGRSHADYDDFVNGLRVLFGELNHFAKGSRVLSKQHVNFLSHCTSGSRLQRGRRMKTRDDEERRGRRKTRIAPAMWQSCSSCSTPTDWPD